MNAPRRPSPTALLRVFGDVRSGEAGIVVLLATKLFLVMMAYYVLKVAREPLILLDGGAELKSYAAVIEAALLVAVASAYGWLASRVDRLKLIGAVTVFFVVNLAFFAWFASRADGLFVGVAFFLWLGIFNLVAVTQFWSFAADLFDEEQGKRLFPVIALGGSVGAVGGAMLSHRLLHHASPPVLIAVAAAILLGGFVLTALVHHGSDHPSAKENVAPLDAASGFRMVLHDRYLLLLAGLILVLNMSTRTGDYVLDRMLLVDAHAQTAVPAAVYIGQFKARFFEWVNVLEILLQALVVSRVIKYGGLRMALVLVPLFSLAGYGAGFAMPVIGVVFATRVAENTLDYSLSNTVRQSLWLVTPRDAKYKAKQVIDAFVWRAGDTMAALIVWLGVRHELGARAFIAVNVVIALLWTAVAILAGTAYDERAALARTSQGARDREARTDPLRDRRRDAADEATRGGGAVRVRACDAGQAAARARQRQRSARRSEGRGAGGAGEVPAPEPGHGRAHRER